MNSTSFTVKLKTGVIVFISEYDTECSRLEPMDKPIRCELVNLGFW